MICKIVIILQTDYYYTMSFCFKAKFNKYLPQETKKQVNNFYLEEKISLKLKSPNKFILTF